MALTQGVKKEKGRINCCYLAKPCPLLGHQRLFTTKTDMRDTTLPPCCKGKKHWKMVIYEKM